MNKPKQEGPYHLGDPTLPHEALGVNGRNVRAVRSGEWRAPKKDEWYLSGADVVAYRAKGDMSTPYLIARLVEVEEVKVVKVIKYL